MSAMRCWIFCLADCDACLHQCIFLHRSARLRSIHAWFSPAWCRSRGSKPLCQRQWTAFWTCHSPRCASERLLIDPSFQVVVWFRSKLHSVSQVQHFPKREKFFKTRVIRQTDRRSVNGNDNWMKELNKYFFMSARANGINICARN